MRDFSQLERGPWWRTLAPAFAPSAFQRWSWNFHLCLPQLWETLKRRHPGWTEKWSLQWPWDPELYTGWGQSAPAGKVAPPPPLLSSLSSSPRPHRPDSPPLPALRRFVFLSGFFSMTRTSSKRSKPPRRRLEPVTRVVNTSLGLISICNQVLWGVSFRSSHLGGGGGHRPVCGRRVPRDLYVGPPTSPFTFRMPDEMSTPFLAQQERT